MNTFIAYLQALDSEVSSKVGSESSKHEHDEEPVGPDENSRRQSTRYLTTALGSERRHGKPEAFLQRETPVRHMNDSSTLTVVLFSFRWVSLVEKKKVWMVQWLCALAQADFDKVPSVKGRWACC
jgi:hypothetical protein